MANDTVNELIPLKEDGDRFTAKAKTALTGKCAVQVSGARTSGGIGAGASPGGSAFQGKGLAATAEGSYYQVGHPGASGAQGAAKRCIGVAAWDTPIGGEVTVVNGGIIPITTSAAITAGQEVEVDAAGKVKPLASGVAVGMAMDDQATVGADAEILWYR